MLSAALRAFSWGALCTLNPIRTSLTFAVEFLFFASLEINMTTTFRLPSAPFRLLRMHNCATNVLFFTFAKLFSSLPLNSAFPYFHVSNLFSDFISFAKIKTFQSPWTFAFYSLATLMAADFIVSTKFNGQFSWLESEWGWGRSGTNANKKLIL